MTQAAPRIANAMATRRWHSTAELAHASGVGIGTVRRSLRVWLAAGHVECGTTWLSRYASTRVYALADGGPFASPFEREKEASS